MDVAGLAKSSPSREQSLLDSARAGDEAAFAELVEAYRRELEVHCYRILGSLQDAEDALQETLLRAWAALPGFAARSSVRTWLYKVATNVSLDAIRYRNRRVLPIDYGPSAEVHSPPGEPLVEAVWIDPLPEALAPAADASTHPEARYEARESVELAFVAAVHHLSPLQRAVLITRDVLGFSASETAEVLGMSVASANSALQRARGAVGDRLPAQSQQETLAAIGDSRLRRLVDAFRDAWERADVDGIVALLAEDATMTMPPIPTWFQGRRAIGTFLAEFAFERQGRPVRLVPISASAQPGFGCYIWDDAGSRYAPVMVQVLSLAGSRISSLDCFAEARYVRAMGLPAELPG